MQSFWEKSSHTYGGEMCTICFQFIILILSCIYEYVLCNNSYYGSRKGTYRFRPNHVYSYRIKLKFLQWM